MPDHSALITRFYTAFGDHDGPAMAACYHAEARFSDPVFPDLRGAAPGAMWRMLTERAQDLVIQFSQVQAGGDTGSAHWEADYTFSATGRKVHNVIDATFTFRDGLILTHTDAFSFYRWSRQAIGPMGWLLGWTPLLRNKVRATAAAGLNAYIAKHTLT